MSVVSLIYVKRHLRLTQNVDDDLLEDWIESAEDEAKQFLDRDELPRKDDPCACEAESDSTANAASDAGDVAPTVRGAIVLLVQAMYEGLSGDEMAKVREVAFNQMRPYRCRMGV